MAESPVPQSSEVTVISGDPPVAAALLAYALFGVGAVIGLLSSGFPAVAPLMGLIGIAGVVVAYVKRDDARGTWVASHLRWLIRTFWYSLLWGVIGGVIFVLLFIVFLLGPLLAFVIWTAASIWVIYRVVRGYLLFNQNKPIPGM